MRGERETRKGDINKGCERKKGKEKYIERDIHTKREKKERNVHTYRKRIRRKLSNEKRSKRRIQR